MDIIDAVLGAAIAGGGGGSVDAYTKAETNQLLSSKVNESVVADAYDATATYAVGAYCIHDNTLYKCRTAITTAEPWTAAHWTETSVDDEIKLKQDASKLVTLISGNSEDTQYPSAKAVWTLVKQNVQSVTFAEAVSLLNAGARDELVGLQIPDTWTDENGNEYFDPWDIWDVRTVTDSNDVQHTGIIIGRHYAAFHEMAYKPTEGVISTEETAQEGVYYFGYTSNSSSPISLNLTTGAEIPYSSYYLILKNDLSNPDLLRNGYSRGGRNRYSQSAINQYLNSNSEIGQWWSSQHIGDNAPSNASTTRGYLAGCSQEFLDSAKLLKVQTWNTLSPYSEYITGKVFLPRIENLMGTHDNWVYDKNYSTPFLYWKRATGLSSLSKEANSGRIILKLSNKTNAANCYTSSAGRGYKETVGRVLTHGGIGGLTGYSSESCHNIRSMLPYAVIY